MRGLTGRIRRMLKKKEVIIPVVQNQDSNTMFIGKTALIAGGSGGIGVAIAKKLCSCGCRVILGGTDSEKLSQIVQKNFSVEIGTALLDYSDLESLNEQVDRIIEQYGGIDLFINSAGVHIEDVDFWTVTASDFDRVIKVNLSGGFFAARRIASHMIDAGSSGAILFISSSRGSEPAWSPYGISKWGVNGMTLGFAQALSGFGITVNAICPGTTATALVGYSSGDSIASSENSLGRLVTSEEVAELAAYILSPSAQMITGETIHISAGRGLFELR